LFLNGDKNMNFTRLSVLLVMAAFLGCGDSGPPLASVKGKVTLYGRPYAKGIVTFTPQDGGPTGSSPTDENGDYELWSSGKRGAQIGKHKVSVTTIIDQPKTTPPAQTSSDDPSYTAFGNPTDYKKVESKKEPIPAKYNTETELVREVNSGSNTIDLDLK
jgi:hypothetical protein